MNDNKLLVVIAIVLLAVGGIVGYALHGASQQSASSFGSAVDCGTNTCVDGGFNVTNNATSTLGVLSRSATKGACITFNATSTNTLLNMTFAATTTLTQASGIGPVISFGGCNGV